MYGNPDGTWEVQLPAEEVPPELPEPALGINFARDGMQVRAETANPNYGNIFLLVLARVFHSPPLPVTHLHSPSSTLQRKDWLALVAVHSDAWLMAVAFYYGAKFDAKERYVPGHHPTLFATTIHSLPWNSGRSKKSTLIPKSR